MSRKLILNEFTALDETGLDESMAGDETVCENLDAISYEVDWENGSSLDGEINIQYKNDGNVWKNLPFASTIALSGASGSHKIDVDLIIFKKIRPYVTINAGQADIVIKTKGTTQGA